MVTRTEKQHIPILMYHSISSCANSGFRSCTVPPKMFDEHLSYLNQHHYTPITVTHLVQTMAHQRNELPPRPVILTFDDGYADFYTHALPTLSRHGFVATLYIATAFVGGTSRWIKYPGERLRPMLTWNQIAEISTNGIECGAHSHTHKPLDMIPSAMAHNEIVRSKELLEEHLGQPVSSFAYPYGYYSAHVRRLVKTAGYVSACAVKLSLSSLHDDPYALARLAITPDTKMQDLEAALSTGRGPLVISSTKRVRASVRQCLRRTYGTFWGSSSATIDKEKSEP